MGLKNIFLFLGLVFVGGVAHGQKIKYKDLFLLLNAKQYTEAEAVYRDITAKDKTNAVAFNNLGAVLEAQSNKTGALDAYREAVRLKTDYVEAINNLKRLQQATKVS